MNLVIQKEILLSNLNMVYKAIPTRSPMAILETILITADQYVRLLGNNLEMGIESADIEADIKEIGSVALEAKIFLEIVRKMPGDLISIKTDDHHVTKIKSEKSEFKVLGLPGNDFPGLPSVKKENAYTVKAFVLRDMIRQTIFSVAVDESKPVLTGELLHVKDSYLHMVSVDGFRISYRCREQEDLKDLETQSVVVPANSLNELSRILPSGMEEDVRFYLTDKEILFETSQFTLVSRLLDGEFIRYNQTFNEDFSTLINVNCSALLQSLDRAALIAKDNKKSPVKLSIGQHSVVITSTTDMGASYDEVDADIDGVELEIAFNPRYLMDALRVIEEERIIITFNGALSPCIIKSNENADYKYLVLPLRLKT